MKSPLQSKRLDNFLCCCSLESGGYFFGWLGVIGSLLTVLISVFTIIAITQGMVTDETLVEMGYGMNSSGESDADMLQGARTVICCVAAVLIVLSLIYLVVSIILIRGTKNRNQRQVKIAVIYFMICAILSIFSLWQFNVSTLFNIAYNIYAAITVYSLWRLFQEEDEIGVQPTAPGVVTDAIE